MKNINKKRLKISVGLLASIRSCPDDERFKERSTCVFCENPDYHKCWFDFINWKLKRSV